jgi:DNA processing protein
MHRRPVTVPWTGHPPAPALRDAIALSTFDLGFRTRAPLAVARIIEDQGFHEADWIDAVLARLEVPRAEWRPRRKEAVEAADRAESSAGRLGLTILSIFDPAYPARLARIADPPIVLWSRGTTPEPEDDGLVAVVGAREATGAGRVMAERLGRELAQAGLGVVSGLARGIDGAAHRGALSAGGRTLAILGSGLDVVYPPEHRDLAAEIVRTGGLLATEFLPGMRPVPRHFPLRNRIISGLVRAVVVVEASERSGSLITAKAALEQGRDVLAVPGGVASGSHRGCHGLIKEGARLVETVEDVLEEIHWPSVRKSTSKTLPLSALEEILPPGRIVTLDELAARTGLPASELLAQISSLELAGRVSRLAGGSIVRLD